MNLIRIIEGFKSQLEKTHIFKLSIHSQQSFNSLCPNISNSQGSHSLEGNVVADIHCSFCLRRVLTKFHTICHTTISPVNRGFLSLSHSSQFYSLQLPAIQGCDTQHPLFQRPRNLRRYQHQCCRVNNLRSS